jgi:hypothetical protein
MCTGAGGEGGAPSSDVGGTLHQSILEVKCAATNNRKDAKFCVPDSANAHVMVKFGGEAGKMYEVVLRVAGVMEGQKYAGGMASGERFYIGGMGTTANYGRYGMKVGETQYWLNHAETGAGGDRTYKMDYMTPPLKIAGGAAIDLSGVDPNNHMTHNFAKHVIEPAPAGLKIMQPAEGNFFYIEVVSAKPL